MAFVLQKTRIFVVNFSNKLLNNKQIFENS
jgi:hypothetical protein